jgi:hypothetical protein
VVFPFIQKPLLDYSFEPEFVPKNSTKDLIIKIHNFGLAPAKHAIGAMKGGDVTFNSITSEPFLSKYFRTNLNGTIRYKTNSTTSTKMDFLM